MPELRIPPPPAQAGVADQELAAVLNARSLLLRLCDHRLTPRVPGAVRSEARALMRWFPSPGRIRTALAPEKRL